MAELEHREVVLTVRGDDGVIRAYRRISQEGDKATRSNAGLISGLGSTNSKLASVAQGGAAAFRALAAGGMSAAGAVVGIGGAAVTAIGGLAVSAVKTLASWLLQATKLAMGLVAAGTAVGAVFAKAAISAAVARDTQMRSLTTIMGASGGQAMFDQLKGISKLPGMDIDSAMRFAQGLIAIEKPAEMVVRYLKAIGNAVALTGGGPEELGRIGRQLVQMFAKGKVMAEDVMIVSESLPQFRAALLKAFGTGDTEALIKRGLTAQQVLDAVIGKFEQLPKATSGPANAMVNLRMAWTDLLVGFGEAFTKAGGIEVINKLAEGLAKLAPVLAQIGQQAATHLPALAKGIEQLFSVISDPSAIQRFAHTVIDGFASVARYIVGWLPNILDAMHLFATTFQAVSWLVRANAEAFAWVRMKFGEISREQYNAIVANWDKAEKAGDRMVETMRKLSENAINYRDRALRGIATAQNEATKSVDNMTRALLNQVKAIEEVKRVTAAVQAGSPYSFAANGNAYNAYTYGQAAALNAGFTQTPNGFFGQPRGIQPGALTPEQHDANWKAEAKRREAVVREGNAIIKNWQKGLIDSHKAIEQLNALNTAESRARAGSIAAIEAEATARKAWQQQLYGQLRGVAGGSTSDLFNNALGTSRQYQQAAEMARRMPGTWMAQVAQGVMANLAPVLTALGFTSPTQMPAYLAALAPKVAKDAKENGRAVIEGDYREQRRREAMSLNDRLAQQVIGNLGAGDQGILSQARLGQSTDAMTTAARRAGRDIGGIIADAIGYELPRAVEAAVARRMRLDYQGAN